MSFINELKRRNVFKVGIAYLVGSWLLIQVADILLDNIGAPAWVLQTLFVALGVGFFITLIVAWAFEMTPEGVKREKDVDRSQSITRKTGQKLNYVVIGMLVMAASYFFWESRFKSDTGTPMNSGDVISAQAETSKSSDASNQIPASAGMTDQGMTAEPSRQSIAVLPFDNRSRLEDDEFFVEGVHDDLLTNLARIGSLKVISRTSVMRYKDTEKPIPEIAKELGVATIMEGAVQRAGNTVRINVQLIDAKTDEHLWAEIFDRELTIDNLFEIQTEISEKIAEALQATLSTEEQLQIERKPTENMAAYQAYLRGRQSMAKRTSAPLEKALAEFRRAVKLDPGFALAWVGVAESANLLSIYGTLSPNDRVSIMEEAVGHALELDPTLGEAYVSRASLFDIRDQEEKAEESYLQAIKLNPNYATAYHWYSDLLQRQPDRIVDALAASNKAFELDPMSSIIRVDRAFIYFEKGELEIANTQFLETLDLEPDFALAYSGLAWVARERGRLDEFFKWTSESLRIDPGSMSLLIDQYLVLTVLGLDEQAQIIFSRMEDLDDKHFLLSIAMAITNLKLGQNAAALEHANYLVQTVDQSWPRWLAGIVYATNKDYAKARELMLSPTRPYTDRKEWPRLMNAYKSDACDIAWVLMQTGDEELGRDLLTFTLEYIEEELPQYIEHGARHGAAGCHAALGDSKAALASLEEFVSHGHLDDWSYFRTWPPLKILLDEPGFIELELLVNERLALQAAAVEAMLAGETS